MIQKEEYLKALEIVEQYHKQLILQVVRIRNTEKTLVSEWLKDNRDKIKSIRVYNILTGNTRFGKAFEYIEDITIDSWKKRYLGSLKSYELLQEYLRDTI